MPEGAVVGRTSALPDKESDSMKELSEEFEKEWENLGYQTHQFSLDAWESLRDDCHTMFLAGAAIGAKRERERIVELMRIGKEDVMQHSCCQECYAEQKLEACIDAIRREGQ